ncbi:MAG: RagB/SusD protein [Geminicoccaceae bacterium]|nr:RagB/SusD protein [Geminicoccaceae bacterium]
MHAYMTQVRGGVRRGAVAILLASLAAGACKSTDEILDVTDPDIINPGNVGSAAGANAVRLGALARLNTATSGGESLFLLGGLFSDEWNNGDSFIARQEVDQRVITIENSFLTTANRALHRARLSAAQAIELLDEHDPSAPRANVAEMYFVQAFVENLMAEHYCNGIIFSDVVDGAEEYGEAITTTETFERALAHADAGLALITGTTAADVRVRNALRVLRGRILLNLDRHADAATAVSDVPTSFTYQQVHATTATENQIWVFNNSVRRYSVSTGEGGNGLDFATANDPRVPVCLGGDADCRAIGVTSSRRDDDQTPLYVQRIWPERESPVTIVSGIEARLIEAEAQLSAGQPDAALATLNAARTTVTGLDPLTDPGTDAERVDQLFRERAFWLFSTGHRTGDMRRLIRQYDRAAATVFPTGAWHKGGNYGADVTVPLPQAEQNNPNLPVGANTCLDRAP